MARCWMRASFGTQGETRESRGFGFLTLETDEDADDAIRALDQSEWDGRIVLVEKAKTVTKF
eukprot:SM000014S00417  [mRNA]  locus=s14:1278441:1278918:+ [translate_table: standard]